MTKRVEQILTGVHFAEEPLSRVCHMVSNVQLLAATPDVDHAEEVDVLCRTDGEWKIARREIILDQNVLLAKNLSIFF